MAQEFRAGSVRAAKPGGGTAAAGGLVPVRVRVTAAGPDFRYSIYAESDTTLQTALATNLTPATARLGTPTIPYRQPTVGTLGIAFIDADGNWVLYHVAQEVPLVQSCDC